MTVVFRPSQVVLGSALGLALALTVSRAEACSICRCGDATFNALGKDVTSEPGFRFAFDVDRFSKTQGPPEEQDSIVEDRYTAVGAYTLGSRALLVARVPFAQRTLDERVGDEVEHSEAIGPRRSGALGADPALVVAAQRRPRPPLELLGDRRRQDELG